MSFESTGSFGQVICDLSYHVATGSILIMSIICQVFRSFVTVVTMVYDFSVKVVVYTVHGTRKH